MYGWLFYAEVELSISKIYYLYENLKHHTAACDEIYDDKSI